MLILGLYLMAILNFFLQLLQKPFLVHFYIFQKHLLYFILQDLHASLILAQHYKFFKKFKHSHLQYVS